MHPPTQPVAASPFADPLPHNQCIPDERESSLSSTASSSTATMSVGSNPGEIVVQEKTKDGDGQSGSQQFLTSSSPDLREQGDKGIEEGGNVSGLDTAPDGGITAWLVVLGSFLVHVVTLGGVYSFGVFESYFVKEGLGTSYAVGFVGSIAAAVFVALGLPSGRLAERFGFRKMILIGTILLTLGLVLASFATQLWQLALTQGLLFGTGASLAYFPAVSVPSQWFSRYRGLATGVAVAGSGVGGLAFSLITQKLLDKIGYGWTMRTLAAISLPLLIIAAFLIQTRIPPTSKPTDWTVLKDKRFLLLLAMGFLGNFALLVPLYFLPDFAAVHLGLPVASGAIFLSIYNGSSAVGRIIMGISADSFLGRINSLVICMLTSALSMLVLWTFAYNVPLLILFAIVNGFVAGGFISLFPVVIGSVFGVDRLPSLTGLIFSSSAFGNLLGAPIAGAIQDATGGFLGPILYAGGVTFLATCCITGVRFMVEKRVFVRV